jgi:chromatin assembly factor 1 subunit A
VHIVNTVKVEYLKWIKSGKTQNARDFTPSNMKEYGRFKLLQFSTDVRPPYFGAIIFNQGTFNRKSDKVNGKCPFKLDSSMDYEYDSEAEWEEDEQGEELHSEEEEAGVDEDEDEQDVYCN